MALTSTLQDFEVRSGLIVLGTSTVTSSTGMTATLQVNGGAAIAKNFIVGGTSDLWSTATVHGNLIVEQGSYLSGATSTGVVSITNNTQATTAGAGALKTTGGAYIGNNAVINSAAASTTTVASNALYVQGGVGINGSLLVDGDAVFRKDVIFAGTTTYVYSTNTVYTDNFIDLHVPNDGTMGWSIDDGKDIGLIFNYYNGGNKDGFLGLDSDTKYLEWFSNGIETAGTFSGSVYGTFKTGSIKLTDSTASTSTLTGALTVAGGIGATGNIFGGSLSANDLTTSRVVIVGDNGKLIDDEGLTYNTVTNLLSVNVSAAGSADGLTGGAAGSLPYQQSTGTTVFLPIGVAGLVLVSDGSKPIWATTGTIASGQAFTATNINFGAQYQIPYQTGFGQTTFSTNLEYDYNALTFRTLNAVFSATTVASSTASGAVQVWGGVGIGGGLWVGSDTTILGDLEVRGGDFTTNQASFNLINSVASTVNIAGAATALTIGATSGNTTVRNQLLATDTANASNTSTGALQVRGGAAVHLDLVVGGSESLGGNLTVGGDLAVNGGDVTTLATTFNLINTTATTVNFAGAGTAITIGSASGYTDVRHQLRVTAITGSSSTGSGALVVSGGVGINENLWVGGSETILGDLEVRGGDLTTNQTTFNLLNATVTTVNFAGAGTAITVGAPTGYTEIRNATTITNSTNASSTSTGALVVAGGVGINEDLYVGGNQFITGDLEVQGGDLTTNQASFNLLNTDNSLVVNFAGSATQLTVGSAFGGFTQIRNLTTLTNTTEATTTTGGALQVRGGVGISKNLYVGGSLNVTGPTTLAELRSTVTTSTNLTVSGPATITGITNLTNSSNAVATNDGALRVVGGVGIGKDVVIGGQLTVNTVDSATTGSVVNAMFSNNLQIATFTSPIITGSGQVSLDRWSSSNFRSARYFCQVTDGSNVHISEISCFHDNTKAYLNEYGIATNNGQLGSFDASIGAGEVTIKFTPVAASTMTVKMVRMGLTA